MLDENFSRQNFKIFFLFLQKIGFVIFVQCLLRQQIALNVVTCFLGKKRKKFNLPSAKFVQRVVNFHM